MKGPSRGGVMEFEAMSRGVSAALAEHDYIGLSSSSSSGCGATSCSPASVVVPDLNESATALRLGPPKAEEELLRPAAAPPPRNSAILEEFRKAQAMKAQQQQQQQQAVAMYPTLQGPFFSSKGYGVKRGFSEVQEVDVKVQTWMQSSYTTRRPVLDAADSSCKPGKKNEAAMAPAAPIDPPAPGQTVGWPPVRTFVKNNAPPPPPASATDSLEKEKEVPSSSSSAAKSLLVKIYMDGVPFGRKVDLKTNNRYEKLFSALEEMFHQFINAGHYSGSQTSTSSTKSHFVPSSSSSSSRKLNFLDGSEYVLIYEDHEGDSMLVGDVPWDLFVNTVKRLRIMKGSEEVNLAPKNTDLAVKAQPAVC